PTPQHPTNFRQCHRTVCKIAHPPTNRHPIKSSIPKRQMFHIRTAKINRLPLSLAPGTRHHSLRKINPDHLSQRQSFPHRKRQITCTASDI
ncbi:MAG: hypothetical protein SPK06_07360, partial [Kiritimatiellia bacterium]|nr:hypothetical protein [Kiritimatiellia bacterium]